MGKTSWQVKARYNAKNYKSLNVQLPIDLAERFDEKTKADGVSKSSVIKQAVQAYLGEPVD